MGITLMKETVGKPIKADKAKDERFNRKAGFEKTRRSCACVGHLSFE